MVRDMTGDLPALHRSDQDAAVRPHRENWPEVGVPSRPPRCRDKSLFFYSITRDPEVWISHWISLTRFNAPARSFGNGLGTSHSRPDLSSTRQGRSAPPIAERGPPPPNLHPIPRAGGPGPVPITGGWLACLWPGSQPTQCTYIGTGEGMLRPPSDPRRLAPLPEHQADGGAAPGPPHRCAPGGAAHRCGCRPRHAGGAGPPSAKRRPTGSPMPWSRATRT